MMFRFPLLRYLTAVAIWVALSSLTGCSMSQMVVRTSATILDGGVEAMDRETDLELARSAIPAQLKLLEGMIVVDPRNTGLRNYAAQALYGYAFGFVELEDRQRAGELYRRGFEHAVAALYEYGLTGDPADWQQQELQAAVGKLGPRAIPSLFWAASCLAKWIDMNRDNPVGIAELANAATLMGRVLELNEGYYYAGPHIFFGVYYGSRAPMFGGDYARSERHFVRARELTAGKFLLTDVMYAEFLDRQRLDQDNFRERLQRVIEAPADLLPEQALVNAIAKDRAHKLLVHETEWF